MGRLRAQLEPGKVTTGRIFIKRPFCPDPVSVPAPALASVKVMSSNVPIHQTSDITAPTPQNTPLTHAPISAGLSRPTVPDISEDAEPAEEPTNVHDAVVGLVQGRLAGLLGKSSGYIESLPDGAKKTIEALKGVQVKQNELQNQYKRECLELEKKVESRVFFSLFFYPSLHPSVHPSICCPIQSLMLRGLNHAVFLWRAGRATPSPAVLCLLPQANRL